MKAGRSGRQDRLPIAHLQSIFLVGLLGLSMHTVQAQQRTDSLSSKNRGTVQERYLVLDRFAWGHKRLRFRQGDEIFFKLKANKQLQKGTVSYVADTTLYLAEYTKPFLISNIRAIRTYTNSGIVRQGRLLFFIGAVAFFTMDFLGANERHLARLPQRSYITAGVFATAGLLCNMFYQRTYPINQRNVLKVIAHP